MTTEAIAFLQYRRIMKTTTEKPKAEGDCSPASCSADDVLREIANIAHHGGLIGFDSYAKAHREICRLTLPWWDQGECSRIQKRNRREQRN